jgi:hypothetical protein
MALRAACSACGFENEAGDEFCGGCGARLTPANPAATRRSSPESYTPRHLADRPRLASGYGARAEESQRLGALPGSEGAGAAGIFGPPIPVSLCKRTLGCLALDALADLQSPLTNLALACSASLAVYSSGFRVE